eukprot:gnl/Spiro4/2478_TR1194_c0_g1_i1.p2 gnl/Spiro4/2478_TR1194_c0_g1~~gnl/Spiro4/2478_TR1194_c0_g1_i1.p2  ORF type:complete len:147 (+),score=36.84 gnl/Spiro4/2478_TR1194_c0_g1_i1:242-682(+)
MGSEKRERERERERDCEEGISQRNDSDAELVQKKFEIGEQPDDRDEDGDEAPVVVDQAEIEAFEQKIRRDAKMKLGGGKKKTQAEADEEHNAAIVETEEFGKHAFRRKRETKAPASAAKRAKVVTSSGEPPKSINNRGLLSFDDDE